ncbi:vacuolar ATPase assembly integral membrane protein vma21 [Ascosphaera atra]|nr:vacuolar ATPase assembly integral membrane protein vma21 [Ascosphaera atra]KAI5310333.1 vacuolar ATPase assembly integral membrane protein vma21 [Ascosphaera atra]
MATRRATAKQETEKTKLQEKEKETVSDTSPAVPSDVIYKLLGFTLAMVVGPLATFFLSRDYVFNGNATWAGASAALMANVVVVGYLIVAWNDEKREIQKSRVGVVKKTE